MVLLGPEELDKKREERAALRAQTAEFERDWEADRVRGVEAGKEEMSMQAGVIGCVVVERERPRFGIDEDANYHN